MASRNAWSSSSSSKGNADLHSLRLHIFLNFSSEVPSGRRRRTSRKTMPPTDSQRTLLPSRDILGRVLPSCLNLEIRPGASRGRSYLGERVSCCFTGWQQHYTPTLSLTPRS